MAGNDTLARMKIHTINSQYRDGESHRLSYTEWGDPKNSRLLFCAHGLSRNSRDFDDLATEMADRYRVICPDYPGRGQSENLVKAEDYDNLNYLIDSQNLLNALGENSVDWIGTSMGGIIGMIMASLPRSPIRKLVLNDVGAHIPKAALLEIVAYLRTEPHFASKEAARHYFKTTYIGFGPMSDRQIDHLTEHGIWPLESGGYQLSCESEIIRRFVRSKIEDVDMWGCWEQIKVPVLLIRGAHSNILSSQEIDRMALNRKNVTTIEFPECGHAPSLMHPDHLKVIRKWLAEA